MPFGAGPCTCPSRYLALQEIKLPIASIPRDFDISTLQPPRDGGSVQKLMQFAMSSVGLSMRLRVRATASPAARPR